TAAAAPSRFREANGTGLAIQRGMMQAGLPIPTPDSLAVSLPQGFERWRDLYLHDAGTKLIAFLVMALVVYVITRVVRRGIRENIDDINRRHIAQMYMTYAAAFLLFIAGVAVLADSPQGFGTILA